MKNKKIPGDTRILKMEHTGFEPVASTMRMLRAPNCANAPCIQYNTIMKKNNKKMKKIGGWIWTPQV
jgi:hypothetical protein